MPFSAGTRVCAGKAFAESNMRILTTFMTEMFDFEYVDKEKYSGPDDYPEAILGQSKVVPVQVYLKLRQ